MSHQLCFIFLRNDLISNNTSLLNYKLTSFDYNSLLVLVLYYRVILRVIHDSYHLYYLIPSSTVTDLTNRTGTDFSESRSPKLKFLILTKYE